MEEPRSPDNEKQSSNSPWTNLGAAPLALAAGVGLFIGYFYGARHGEFHFEALGTKIIAKPPSDVGRLIDITDPHREPRVIDAMARKISEHDHSSALGKRIISIAKARSHPFTWEGQEIRLEAKSGLPKSMYFQACRGNPYSGKEVNVDVEVRGELTAIDAGVVAQMPPEEECKSDRLYTGNKQLINESQKESARVLATEVIRLPYHK